MAKQIIAIATGASAAYLKAWGSTLIITALKGLLGGVMGYVGTVLMTWILKEYLKPAARWLMKRLKTKKQKR